MTGPTSAPQLLRGVGLLADGPVLWGRPIPARTPGVYLVELPSPLPSPPIDHARVATWLDRVPDLRLDGKRPTAKDLVARLARYWFPETPVVFVGSTKGSLAGRIDALRATPLGDARPYSGGHRLMTLRGLETCRVWWAVTDAPQEYEDALLDAFADGLSPAARGSAPEPILPYAVLRRPTGEHRSDGITGAVRSAPDAVDATPSPRPSRGSPTSGGARRSLPSAPRSVAVSRPAAGSGRSAVRGPTPGKDAAVHLSAEGLEQLRDELRRLRDVDRPAALKRLVAARELGDLRENGDYQAAREELGFIDGRVQMLDAQLQNAAVFEKPAGPVAGLGSTVLVEIDGVSQEFRLVGSREADPTHGRISTSSPVGHALAGHAAGDEITVRTPGGDQHFRVLEVR